MEKINSIVISNITKISAIYFGLLQSGYDYYSMGRDAWVSISEDALKELLDKQRKK